jgi:hypothetical protein
MRAMLLFGLDPEYDRLRIRALRATFNRSGDDERRRLVFIGALGQFDELMTAAASVGPASRPLPLYYALNQAGRAIVAQRQMRDQPWEPKSHGLTVRDPPDGWLQQTPIKPQRHENSSFRLLSESIRTARLTEHTTLANVWAAIPNLPKPGLGAGCPRALPLEVVHVDPIVSGTLRRLDGLGVGEGADERLRGMLSATYPKAADGLQIDSVEWETAHFEGSKAQVSWRTSEGTVRPIYASASRYLGGYWLIPRLNKAGDVLEPLMLWWCLLHALSQLARYHPAEWTVALDPDNSRWAVSIEQVLGMALSIVPRLVLNTLSPGTEEIIGLDD